LGADPPPPGSESDPEPPPLQAATPKNRNNSIAATGGLEIVVRIGPPFSQDVSTHTLGSIQVLANSPQGE
jgi:hypothetical protein